MLRPNKSSSLPSAKVNHKDKLVFSAADINGVMVKEYRERLRHRPKHPNMKKLFKQDTISYKLEPAKANKSPKFDMDELEKVLNKTKSGKARDPELGVATCKGDI